MIDNLSFKKVEILNENDQTIISSTNVTTLENKIFLHGQNFILIDQMTRVRAVGIQQDGVVIMEGMISLSTNSQVNIDITELKQKNERRSYFKVKTYQKSRLLRAYSLGDSNRSYKVNENISIRDISVGGVCILSNKTFFVNQRLAIELGFLKDDLVAEIQVLRKHRDKSIRGYRYRYGCKFLNLNNEQDRKICEYVFRVQVEERRKTTV